MAHLAGADAEGQRAERSVRGGVAIAADDGHAGLREALLGSHHVHDALFIARQIVETDAEVGAVLFHLRELGRADLDRRIGQVARRGGRRVVHGRDGQIRPADFEPAVAQRLEGLRRGDFVTQVQIDVDQRGGAGFLGDDVAVPDFFDDGAGVAHNASLTALPT